MNASSFDDSLFLLSVPLVHYEEMEVNSHTLSCLGKPGVIPEE